MNRLLIALGMLMAVSCQWNRQTAAVEVEDVLDTEIVSEAVKRHFVDVVNHDSLMVYYPDYSRIDLVTETMPSSEEKDVILCVEAAFTGELLDEFSHENIAGHHVSGGVFYEGYKCRVNNGVFTWDPVAGARFNYCGDKTAVPELKAAANNNGMGFCQHLLVYKGGRRSGCFSESAVNEYRALCELGGRICVVDCARPLPFASFMSGLMALGVRNAIYCDMGAGWNYSWYRQDDGSIKEMFPVPGRYTTNWVVFYAEL